MSSTIGHGLTPADLRGENVGVLIVLDTSNSPTFNIARKVAKEIGQQLLPVPNCAVVLYLPNSNRYEEIGDAARLAQVVDGAVMSGDRLNTKNVAACLDSVVRSHTPSASVKSSVFIISTRVHHEDPEIERARAAISEYLHRASIPADQFNIRFLLAKNP